MALNSRLTGPMRISAAVPLTGTACRGLYAVGERLKRAGLVATMRDPHNHGARRLSIHPSAPLPAKS